MPLFRRTLDVVSSFDYGYIQVLKIAKENGPKPNQIRIKIESKKKKTKIERGRTKTVPRNHCWRERDRLWWYLWERHRLSSTSEAFPFVRYGTPLRRSDRSLCFRILFQLFRNYYYIYLIIYIYLLRVVEGCVLSESLREHERRTDRRLWEMCCSYFFFYLISVKILFD